MLTVDETNKTAVFRWIRNEHPQVIATFFRYINDPSLYGEFLDNIPKRLQTDVTLRMLSMDDNVVALPIEIIERCFGMIDQHATVLLDGDMVYTVARMVREKYLDIEAGIEEIDPCLLPFLLDEL
jgi:hypothetical protein